MSSPLLPLLALVVNALLVVVAGFAGGIGLLLAGEWGLVALGVAAAAVFPVALVTLHRLRWLIDIRAMLASDDRHHWLAALLAYVTGQPCCAAKISTRRKLSTLRSSISR